MLQKENKLLSKHLPLLVSVIGPHGLKLSFKKTWVAARR